LGREVRSEEEVEEHQAQGAGEDVCDGIVAAEAARDGHGGREWTPRLRKRISLGDRASIHVVA
jgi:hypothetical protein